MGYLVRHRMRDIGSYATAARDTLEVVEERLGRILDALVDKEQRYRDDTDVLVIREQILPKSVEPTLKARLAEEVSILEPSNYSATYITFNEAVFKVR